MTTWICVSLEITTIKIPQILVYGWEYLRFLLKFKYVLLGIVIIMYISKTYTLVTNISSTSFIANLLSSFCEVTCLCFQRWDHTMCFSVPQHYQGMSMLPTEMELLLQHWTPLHMPVHVFLSVMDELSFYCSYYK